MTTISRVPTPDLLLAGRYRLQSRIGEGGMGSVWLATDQRLSREVAVKRVVALDGVPDESAERIREKALREGRIAARLTHRNAVAVHDVALDQGTPWLVMEYLPSRSVAEILHTVGNLGAADAAQIGAQVASAMVAAHESGIIHRDIKPGNILISGTGPDAGVVKLSDFGIAHLKDDETAVDDDLITGTPAYFAPEVARGAVPAEPSDVYSLGSTIYTMVEGQPPFGADDDTAALLDRVARARIRPPEKAGPLTDVLLAMLTPSPAKRPTMAQVRDQLAVLAASATRSTPGRILSGRIQQANGTVPVWALTTPQAPRMSTGSYARSSVTGPFPPARPPMTPARPPMRPPGAPMGPSGPRPMGQMPPVPVPPPPPRAGYYQPPQAPRGWRGHRKLVISGTILALLIVVLALILLL